jgi:hypothetical protein
MKLSELDEWKQAARVEAALRREFYDKATSLEAEVERLRRKLAEIHEISQQHLEPAWQVIENVAATARSALDNEQIAYPSPRDDFNPGNDPFPDERK